VADASLGYDSYVKVSLCAQASIPEVLIVNLIEDLIYTDSFNGLYQQTRTAKCGKSFTLKTVSDVTINVDAVLG